MDPNGHFIKWLLDKADKVLTYFGVDTAEVGAFCLDMKEGKYNRHPTYHAREDCWQKNYGYNPLYDEAFRIGTDMESERFDFTYQGTSYTLWAWKGDYINMGAGAEFGIYTGSGYHKTVDTSLAMPMSMTLKYNGNTIAKYSPSEKQLWITSFVPDYKDVSPSELTATYARVLVMYLRELFFASIRF